LILEIPGLSIEQSYYDHANWVVILRKFSDWYIIFNNWGSRLYRQVVILSPSSCKVLFNNTYCYSILALVPLRWVDVFLHWDIKIDLGIWAICPWSSYSNSLRCSALDDKCHRSEWYPNKSILLCYSRTCTYGWWTPGHVSHMIHFEHIQDILGLQV
jgi:hypothetical protein